MMGMLAPGAFIRSANRHGALTRAVSIACTRYWGQQHTDLCSLLHGSLGLQLVSPGQLDGLNLKPAMSPRGMAVMCRSSEYSKEPG